MNQKNPEKVLEAGKTTTTSRLNIRSDPTKKGKIIGVVNKNIQLAYDGYTIEGENIAGNSKWYFTNEGSWFWSGGVNNTKSISSMILGQKIPNKAEGDTVGSLVKKITRNSKEFKTLVSYQNDNVIFKDEEGTGADRMMTTRLAQKVDELAKLVLAEWNSKIKLRITEAWDENIEHAPNSIHYEARAADITTSDRDPSKLGRLGTLAVQAGFDWVFYENTYHVHVSVSREPLLV